MKASTMPGSALDEARLLIREGDLSAAIEVMEGWIKAKTSDESHRKLDKYRDELILHAARTSRATSRFRTGVITREEFDVGVARASADLLLLIGELEKATGPIRRYAIFSRAAETMAAATPTIENSSPLLGQREGFAGGEPLKSSDTRAATSEITFVEAPQPPPTESDQVAIRAPVMPLRLIEEVQIDAAPPSGDAWGIEVVGAAQSQFTGAGVCVAVLDTGIDPDHPAFDGLVRNDNYEDFTSTGRNDKSGHGTHCAGIIFGRDVAGKRIGVARGVKNVLIAKVADGDTLTSTEQIEKALLWALRKGANIIAMSVGLDFLAHSNKLRAQNMPEDAAIALALTDYRDYAHYFDLLMRRIVSPGRIGQSALVIAAAGNDSHADSDPPYRIAATLPAAASDVISVGALARDEAGLHLAPFSNERANVCAWRQHLIRSPGRWLRYDDRHKPSRSACSGRRRPMA
jgi:hypothetical protein